MRNKFGRYLGISIAGATLAVGGVVVASQANADVLSIGDTAAVFNKTNPGKFCNGTIRSESPQRFIEVDAVCMIKNLTNNHNLEAANHYKATDNKTHQTRTALELDLPPGGGVVLMRMSPFS
jgi:hypothetical protein